MWLASKNDALSADTFDEVVASDNCLCSSVHVSFSFEKLQRRLLRQGAWSPCSEAVLNILWLASHHLLNKVGLENVNLLLQ